MRRFNLLSLGLAMALVTLPALAQTAVSLDTNSSVPLNSGNSVGLFVPSINPPANLENADTGTREDRRIDRVTDREISQQEQIEQGLKSGEITDAEAARLERGEARIDELESKILGDNNLTAFEAARLNAGLSAEEQRIQTLENNNVTNTSSSPSTQRLEADVQRDIHQQQRIDNGFNQGSLTVGNVGTLEARQARNDVWQAYVAQNGVVRFRKRENIQEAENNRNAEIRVANNNNNGISNNHVNISPTVLGAAPSNVTSLNTNTSAVSLEVPASSAAAMGNSAGFTSTAATAAMGNSTGFANATTGTTARTTTLTPTNASTATSAAASRSSSNRVVRVSSVGRRR